MALRGAALLLLASVLCSYVAAFTDEAQDCCLSTKDKRIPHKVVVSYKMQTVEEGCPIPATLFITKKEFRLCAPLPSGNNWVAQLISRLSNDPKHPPVKKSKSQKKKKRGTRS
ncbi:C-C motif chemokine 19-like [Megalops cyprinoides]|uniref:C-C motif chemokine 19-like n=1 Tax=Megalops cyprinoides TaxID=118141 RepID=UPI001865206F|nr:C-C motif chemokine 19-like [Megalops cyprinoides]